MPNDIHQVHTVVLKQHIIGIEESHQELEHEDIHEPESPLLAQLGSVSTDHNGALRKISLRTSPSFQA